MKKIFEYRCVFQNGQWGARMKRLTLFTETTVPQLHAWLKRGSDYQASYFCYESEVPDPRTPAGVELLEVSLNEKQLAEIAENPKGCGCKKNKKTSSDTVNSYTKKPSDTCIACAEKHLGTAYALYAKESGYRELNRWHYIGELNNAQQHIYDMSPEFSEKIRALRHDIQSDVIVGDERWQQLAVDFEALKLQSTILERDHKKIYVMSNVPAQTTVELDKDDLLVMLNKAVHADRYQEHKNKCVFHRSDKIEYGEAKPDMANFYVFGTSHTVPSEFIDKLKVAYDWNYDIEPGKVKSCTTGYMVVKYLANIYPDAEIILVNFGYEVAASTYRCPWHNWEFESVDLQGFKHINL